MSRHELFVIKDRVSSGIIGTTSVCIRCLFRLYRNGTLSVLVIECVDETGQSRDGQSGLKNQFTMTPHTKMH